MLLHKVCVRCDGKYERLMLDMCKDSESVVRQAVEVTDKFKLGVGLHQRSALCLFSISVVMDKLTDGVRQEVHEPWCLQMTL